MRTAYTIVIVLLSLLLAYLSPNDTIRMYVMFGLLVMMHSVNRWENDKILKEIKASTSEKSKALNIPDVRSSLPDVDVKKFSIWLTENYIRMHGGWMRKYSNQHDLKNLLKFDDLVKHFIKIGGNDS